MTNVLATSTFSEAEDGASSLSSSQQLLVTLISDYWFASTEPIPSAALVALLAEFGVTETGSRAALSRSRGRTSNQPAGMGRAG